MLNGNNKFHALTSLGIRAKLAATLVIGLIAILTVIFAMTLQDQNSKIKAIQQNKAQLIAGMVANRVAGPTQFRDADRLQEIANSILSKDASLMVVDVLLPSGGVLSENGDRGAELATHLQNFFKGQPIDSDTMLAAPKQHLIISHPIESAKSGNHLGTLVMAWDSALDKAAMIQKTKSTMMWSALAGLTGLVLLILLIGRMVTRPIHELSGCMQDIAQQNFGRDIPYTHRGDEIGRMAQTLTQFRDVLAEEHQLAERRSIEAASRQKLFQRLADGLSDLAEGRVDYPIEIDEFADLDEDHRRVCINFNAVVEKLLEVLSTINASAESVRNSAAEIADTAMDQSKRSEAQAVTLEESAAAIESLSASVEQIAENASEASQSINLNRKQAQSGGDVVSKTIDAMKNIERSSEQITAIIGVIDDIAFQTNLLALNAGVEAARAGEAGRGFAVVASEVRALAQRASESANEIKDLILRSGEQVTNGSALASKAGSSLNEIIRGVNHASDLVAMIATSSREQANNLAEIKDSVTELDRVTQQNAAVIEESSAASRSLSEEAARLAHSMKGFQLGEPVTEQDLSNWAADLQSERYPDQSVDPELPEPKLVFSSRAGGADNAVRQSDEWHDF